MRYSEVSLLIGSTGFIGRNLAHFLNAKGEQVVGTYAHSSQKGKFDRKIRLVFCDVTRQSDLFRVLRRFKPRYIYYLAAQSSVRHAWLKPVETIQVNFLGGVYLLEALKQLNLDSKVLIFSSGTTYGESHDLNRPLSEEVCLRPKDPYSVSKMSIDFFARLYARVFGLRVCVVRLTNLAGPGQSTVFSISNFASQIAEMESGHRLNHVLHVGNLSAKRDYLDIRDGLRALYLAMKRGRPGEAYNIASGTSRLLKDVLYELVDLSKLKNGKIKVQMKKGLIPKDEIHAMRLNATKFKKLTGWYPKIEFHQTLSDLLDEWRNYWRQK